MKILALAAAILLFAFPMAGFAEDDPSLWPFGYWGPILSCTGEYYSTGTPAVVGAIIALGSFLIISTFLWLIGNPSPTSDKPRVSWPDINCQSSNVPGYPISPVAPPGGEE
ncbi:MAG: hypothetical protein UY99_C0012G0004 [Parcubacteria group bacterium GW2011_GWA1_59_11]|nr:MAG: hypothetical protein UY99_C0012G0004 [Parcubacteria group bacterium GW2011_GWA1_59_11]